MNVIRQSSCLVINPIPVNSFASFFNCTPVGRASDSIESSCLFYLRFNFDYYVAEVMHL